MASGACTSSATLSSVALVTEMFVCGISMNADVLRIFKGHTSTVRSLQIVLTVMVNGIMQPSHPLIVTASGDHSIRVWKLPDVETNEPSYDGEEENPWLKFALTGHTDYVRHVAVHGNTLVSGGYDKTVVFWDLETGRVIHRMVGHTHRVYALVIDPERQQCGFKCLYLESRYWRMLT